MANLIGRNFSVASIEAEKNFKRVGLGWLSKKPLYCFVEDVNKVGLECFSVAKTNGNVGKHFP